jgi:hypothetical protein
MPRKMVGLGLAKILRWNTRTRLRIVDTARGAVAFLLFLLPKPSVEAEQRQQMVPRAPAQPFASNCWTAQGQWPGHQ